VFEVAKVSKDVRDLRQRIECTSYIPLDVETSNLPMFPVPEMLDGPVDDVDLLNRLRDTSVKCYVVSICILLQFDYYVIIPSNYYVSDVVFLSYIANAI